MCRVCGKKKQNMLPYILIGMLMAVVAFFVVRAVKCKCRHAERAVADCMKDDLFCDCEPDSES